MRRFHRPLAGALALLVGASPLSAGCGRRGERPRFDVVVVSLREASEIGADATKIPLASASHPSLLSIAVPPHLAGGVLEARILSASGEIVWVGVGLRRGDNGIGELFLPAGFLSKGDYRLSVGRSGPEATRGEFPFRVD